MGSETNCGKCTDRLQSSKLHRRLSLELYLKEPENHTRLLRLYLYFKQNIQSNDFFFLFFKSFFFVELPDSSHILFSFRSLRHGGRTKSQEVPPPSRSRFNRGECHFWKRASFRKLSTHQEFETSAQTSTYPFVSSITSFFTAFPAP